LSHCTELVPTLHVVLPVQLTDTAEKLHVNVHGTRRQEIC